MNRRRRQELAQHTLAVLESGKYTAPSGATVSIQADLQACLAATRLHAPEELARCLSEQQVRPAQGAAARIEVVNETTLQGIARLHAAGVGPIGVLNFASARNPGGGFESGSQAQEESLARSSALHASLLRAWPYYEHNRRAESLLYSDDIIYSPSCPVFRDDSGELLEAPRLVDFLSCAAPNAGAVRANQPLDEPSITPTLQRRAANVLALAAAHGLPALVLGAWGCGVFRNEPEVVAGVFSELLLGAARWARCFTHVTFSVFNSTPDRAVLRAFEQAFPAAPQPVGAT